MTSFASFSSKALIMYLAREIKRNVDKETVSHVQLHT